MKIINIIIYIIGKNDYGLFIHESYSGHQVLATPE